MNPILEKVLEDGVGLAVSAVVGYVGALFRLKHRFDKAEKGMHDFVTAKVAVMDKTVDEIEERLRLEFDGLKKALGQGLHLELDTIKEHVRSEVVHMRERLEDLKQMAEDLRVKSGDYTEEAEMAAFMGKVSQWMERTNLAVGRLEGMLGTARSAITTRPPPMPPRPVPRPPRGR